MLRRLLILLIATLAACGKPTPANSNTAPIVTQVPAKHEENTTRKKSGMGEAAQIASLIDPTKLATLRERGTNPRVQKITAILASAKVEGKNPDEIAREAVALIGWGESLAGDLTAAAIVRNLTIAERLGATTPEDIAEMRKGNAATVRNGSYAGDVLSVDHIIPRSLAPQLDNCIANLELMPLRVNQKKGDTVGQRQHDLAQKLYAAGLLASPKLPE